MTAISNLPPITCPSSLIASCGPLLGFEPSHCVVALVGGVPDRGSPVIVRMELVDEPYLTDAVARTADSIVRTGGRIVHLVAWVEAGDSWRRDQLPSGRFLDTMCLALEDHGVDVPVTVSTNGHVWWDHGCPDELCCGGSNPVDLAVMTAVRAEYVFAGYAPLKSRELLAQQVAMDPQRAEQVRAVMRPGRPRNLERWRTTQINALSTLLLPQRHLRALLSGPQNSRSARPPLDPAIAARTLRGMRDIVVRDVLLRRFIVADPEDREGWQWSVDVLCDLVQCAPSEYVAPAATLLANVAWMGGDGALANLALDRADDAEPEYTLAQLSRQVITRGVDPRSWRESMSVLTEWECRRGPRGR